MGNIFNGDLKIHVLWNTQRPSINVQNGSGSAHDHAASVDREATAATTEVKTTIQQF